MRLVWLTDIHLNFLEAHERVQFYQSVKGEGDAIVISGDIAEANSVVEILQEMAAQIEKPIYFVLGNHDYYRGQVDEVRERMKSLTRNDSFLFWLGACEPIFLEGGIILVGQDGWADGRYGDYGNSPVSLNDSRLIADLFQKRILGREELLKKMQQLADADANFLYDNLKQAATQKPRKIIVLTHVPPFKEASFHEGEMTNDDFLPFFSSKATGDVLMKFAKEYPSIEILMLCGHTHDACQYSPLHNLIVLVGKAEYMHPAIQSVIDTQN